ncbi:MAG: HAMP domain-containing histidine kinase [Solibacillus sp.]
MKQWLLNLSLKKKWTVAVGCTIFISYTIIACVLYVALQTWLLNNEEKNAQRTVDDITMFLAAQGGVTIQQLQNNSPLMKAILTQEQTVRIFNLDGVEVLRINDVTDAASIPAQLPALTKETIHGTNAYVYHTVVQIGPFQGILQLIHPLTTFQAMMNYMMTTLVIIGLGALLLALTLSYYLANLLMKPLVELRESMVLVRDHGFEEKVDFKYAADDEIGELLHMYEAMLRELELSFTQQQQFVADASHELRTPIQVIEGHLSMLQRWGKHETDVLEEGLATSLEEIARMKKMIEELLELARRETLDQYATTNVIEDMQLVQSDLQHIYPHVQFLNDVVEQPVLLPISSNALMQILRNLYENAIRYNEREPIVKTTISSENGGITVTIADNGMGIRPEHLTKIFDRFYRVDEARTQKIAGTGLGLSITKMLVEKYRAKITVKSELGKGTKFILHFLEK